MSMPSRAVTSFLPAGPFNQDEDDQYSVNALSGCYLISTLLCRFDIYNFSRSRVNALSGCYLISTEGAMFAFNGRHYYVSMPSRAVTSFLPAGPFNQDEDDQYSVNALSGCYLISTLLCRFDIYNFSRSRVNALSGCYLISTEGAMFAFNGRHYYVSMPSRAVTSFLPEYCNAKHFAHMMCQCPLGLLPHFYRLTIP